MAFPTVQTTNTGANSTAGTSHPISMPSGITAGDLLIIFFTDSLGTGSTNSFSGGFSTLPKGDNGTIVGSQIAYKTAAGGDTCTVTTTGTTKSAHQSYRISGWHGTTIPEQGTWATGASGTSADPPSLNPTNWDVEDTLWLETASNGNSPNYTAGSTNYTDFIHSEATGGGGATQCNLGTARRNLAAASDDPDAFAGATVDWVANLLAIRPAAAAADTLWAQTWM